ncbi:MAG: phage tail protein [Eubacterium sp.]|nr:phage tail protein [Eubacterium sp.]
MAQKGSMSINFTNHKQLKGKLQKIEKASTKALDSAIRDTVSRAPAQVTKAVTEKYNIKKSEMTAAGKQAKAGSKKIGTVKAAGHSLHSVALVYKGRRLTPLHFGMTPKALPANGRRYKLKVQIFKGKKVPLKGPSDRPVFLGSNKGGGYIPFQRAGSKSHPIHSVKAVGIPQMIDNKDVRKKIDKYIGDTMIKRYEHQANRAIDKAIK